MRMLNSPRLGASALAIGAVLNAGGALAGSGAQRLLIAPAVVQGAAALLATAPRRRAEKPAMPALSAPDRRRVLRAGTLGFAALVGAAVSGRRAYGMGGGHSGHGTRAAELPKAAEDPQHAGKSHFGNIVVGEVDRSIFDPTAYLTEFDYGRVSTLPDGRTLREFDISAVDTTIEVAPGVSFAAWAYNGKVPGPTLRATEGDVVRIKFTNAGAHPHTMHFHGFHSAGMDGVFELVNKGETFVYEFEAAPFGLHLYHCHTPPLKRHIHKGLYGTFIIDPKQPRPPAKELVMMMNGFDVNLDGENEIYAVNTVAHYYMRHPIKLKVGELVRIYLVNILEFDLINSFHSHATFFHEYRTGTMMEPNAFTDTIILGQGERSILEVSYREPGNYMFHAHVSEFAELGWAGMFEVTA